MANEQMEFPETWEEYEKDYGFNDSKEVYTNNSRLIPSFRVKQWLDHLPSIQPKTLEDLINITESLKEQGFIPKTTMVDFIEIPEGATNGDMQISLYPNLKYTIQNGRVVTTIGVASSFDLDWWNSPYRKEQE